MPGTAGDIPPSLDPSKGRAVTAMAWILAALMAVALGYFGACYAVSRWLTRPARGALAHTPGDFGLTWENVACPTTDGIELAGWVMEPPAPRATVVLHHGLRCSREQILGRATILVRAGYRCVAFDHRGHGQSSGSYTSFGYHEAADTAAVLDFVRRRWPQAPRAVVGLSMGAAAVVFAAEQTRAYDAVILESLYHDIASAFTARLTTTYPIWFRPLTAGIIRITEWRLGVPLARVVPAEHVGKLSPTPVLLLTGTDDYHADPASVQRLFERCGEPREFWLVPGAHHADVLEVAGRDYEERILAFLDRRLPTKPS
ncbi:MAG TPA: alpha/beta fold hydrolase [Gemmataceae bacterium]|nr:alpha/beta fold hydrolase [Gemmataceae bacterium]